MNDVKRPQFKLKVLVAEDYEFNLEIILGMLSLFGITADIAIDGAAVVEKTKKTNYDLILMDVRMPIMDGYEASKAIRNLKTQQPIIIALTASALISEDNRLSEAKMNSYLLKPIEIVDIERILLKFFPKAKVV